MRAYTYYLYHTPTGKKYYGSSYNKKANPNQLWVSYFSSSKEVHKLIKEHGKESFCVEIRKEFNNALKAYEWEQNVLRRMNVVHRPDWINKAVFSPHCICEMTDEVRLKLSQKNTGKKLSEETKKKISESLKGKKHSKESIERVANFHRGRKRSPETRERISKAIKGKRKGIKFTEEHKENLSKATLKYYEEHGTRKYSEEHKKKLSHALNTKMDKEKRYNEEWRLKMAKGKTGTKRKYLPDGSYIMVRP